ncbi:cytochrome P450 [Mycena olivaceomarginata]|nr:cytochrome P450 [Mycena olivaceomarginata]
MPGTEYHTCFPSSSYLQASYAVVCPPKRGLPLPPGPPHRYITGNLHQLPTSQPWLKPSHLPRVFHRTEIILNSAKAATDLLDARSLIYSDRPPSRMGTLAGRARSIFLLSSAHPWFPRYRKMLHAGLSRRAAQARAWRPAQELQLGVLIRIGGKAGGVCWLIKTYCSRLGYGTTTRLSDEYTDCIWLRRLHRRRFLRDPHRGRSNAMTKLIQPFFLIEIFSFLRFLPRGSRSQVQARVESEQEDLDDIEIIPFEWAKNKIETGTHSDSFFSQYFVPSDSGSVVSHGDEEGRYSSGRQARSTAVAHILLRIASFLFMSTHPAVQKRTQDEINAHLGGAGPPHARGPKALPYISALIKEVLRSAPVAPLGLKHRVTQDDVYNGLFIPKGGTIIANIWAIAHDDEVYPDPFAFDPTRYLGRTPSGIRSIWYSATGDACVRARWRRTPSS